MQAKVFFVAVADGLPSLRGAISNVWLPERLESPRYTNLWMSEEDAEEAAVLLDVGPVRKLATLSASEQDAEQDPRSSFVAGAHYFASCQARMFPREK